MILKGKLALIEEEGVQIWVDEQAPKFGVLKGQMSAATRSL